MANTPLLGLLLPSTGTLDGTWGTAVNTQITSLIDSAIAGTTTLTTDANVVLTDTSEAPNQSRQAIILCTGARTVQRTVVVPARSKTYIVINATTGGYGVLVDAGGSGVTVPAGKSCVVAWDGLNVVAASDYIPNAKIDSLALTNALSVPNGGTGATTLTGLVKGNGTSAMTAVAAPTGAVVGTTDTQTLTGKTINGPDNTLTNIANASLANSAVTINGVAVSLGGSATIGAATAEPLTVGTGLELDSGTTFNGSAAKTISVDDTVVATLAGTQTLTNKTINGSNNTLSNIANASLVNSGVTVNGTAISLGGTGSVTATTTNALTVGSGLQLDSGTTFDGSAAKTLSVDSSVATLTGTQTLTNKRVTPRVSSTATTATLTPDVGLYDQVCLTGQSSSLTVAVPTGTPTDGQKLIFRFKDNGTGRSIAWNSVYRAIGVTRPTTTVASKLLYVGCIYNTVDSNWDMVAVSQEV